MPRIASKFKEGLDNLGIDLSRVNKVKRGVANPQNPYLSVLYFYGTDEANRERVVRTWFYNSEINREKEVRIIQEKFPELPID
jgi:hypothetical protein